jgi:predicted 3-demethylubiquinone-9 3-methyltransferase (glyoxalase superfamily)
MRTQITPFLLFNDKAEQAANFYVSVFKGRIIKITHYPANGPMPPGTAMTATFEIFGMTIVALNSGWDTPFTNAISLSIEPETQEETDYYWNALLADGGQESQCGWLTDRFGVSWQVTPEALPRLMGDPDPKRSSAVMQAMIKMRKIIIKDIEEAYQKA